MIRNDMLRLTSPMVFFFLFFPLKKEWRMWLLANVLVHPETRGCIIPCPEDKNWHGQARTSCDYQHQLYRSRLNKTIIMIIDHHDHWSSRSSPYLTSSAAISPPSWHWNGQARTSCHHKHKLYRSPSRLSWLLFWSSWSQSLSPPIPTVQVSNS